MAFASALADTGRRTFLPDLMGRAAQALVVPARAPVAVFLLALATMLFRPPGPHFASLDRVAFALLVIAVGLRLVALRERLLVSRTVLLPLSAFLVFGAVDVAGNPFDVQEWSVFAAKWGIPFALYCFAGYVFADKASEKLFESFALLTLAYLAFIAVAFLFGAEQLIFPRFILDPSLGIHSDRARGPFLQAVANGMTLNILGLLALASIERGRLRRGGALAVLLGLPLAILATKTRAVWMSFAGSIAMAAFVCRRRTAKRLCILIIMGSAAAGLGAWLLADSNNGFEERLFAESQVQYRVSVYEAAWQMFLEKPALGWGASAVQPELARRISGFKVDAFYFHNTYLEIAVERGVLGLGFYAWLLIDLFRIGRSRGFPAEASALVGAALRRLWPVILLVYLINASFVGMNYAFVNGLLFTLAGMLAGDNVRRQWAASRCPA